MAYTTAPGCDPKCNISSTLCFPGFSNSSQVRGFKKPGVQVRGVADTPPPSTPQVLYTEKCVRALKGTELSKSKEWKMTPPKTIQWGVYVGEVGEGTETTFRRAPLSPAQSPGTCLHDTVHLSLKLNRGIWDLMLTFQGNFRWRGQGNAGGAMM